MKTHHFITTVFIFLLLSNIYAQQNDAIIFTVNATGTFDLLADNINISMNLGVENKNPQKAFDEHKAREQIIIKLIKKYGILDEDITYSLFSIYKYQDYRDKSVSFQTNQTVHFILKDFKMYIPLQIDLLKNGFYGFKSNFSSSKNKEGHKKSVKNALQNAREEAKLYASNLNLKIGKIVSVSTENQEIKNFPVQYFKADIPAQAVLINIPQYISITTNVKVVYTFVE